MASLIPSLNSQVPIVNSDGTPTPLLQRLLNKLQIAAGSGVSVSASGKLDLAAQSAKTILANITSGSAAPTGATLSQILDFLSPTQGSILYRDASTWNILAPGTSGNVLTTQGAGANPKWAAASGGGSGFGTVDVSAYTITGGPLSAPTEVTDQNFGYGFSHTASAITTNNFWFRTRTMSGDTTIITRCLASQESNGNSSFGILFRQSSTTTFVALLFTWNTGSYCEVTKSTNDGASSGAPSGSGNLSVSGLIPMYLKATYVASSNTLTFYVSNNGIIWDQLYSGTTDVTPNQVGFVQRMWNSSGLPVGGVYKYWSDSGITAKWNLP